MDDLFKAIKEKPDVHDFANQVMQNAGLIPRLLNLIATDRGSTKFYCDKVIRTISETQPELIYPYFERIVPLIDSPNNFIKWGAIITLSNLISVDKEKKFDLIYERYFDLINSDSMITAANVAGTVWKVVQIRPEFETDLTRRLLKITENTYLYKGQPSPECKNILFGHAIDCFDKYFERANDKAGIIEFVSSQTNNTRKQVARKAESFLKKHRDLR